MAMMICVTVLICVFGLINYMAFGKETAIIITLNYEQTYVNSGVLFLYVMSIILTYPMSLIPINIIIEETLEMRESWTYVSRIVLVLCSITAAILLNDCADKYLSVLGAVFCAPVGFILPTLMYLFGVPNLSCFSKFSAIFMLVFGVASGSLATYVSISNW
jgi:amino acid permease|mmetsp:Transcript_14752/g.2446  ORF Transcript_14752/g.2446 Transcript_14752/m.2446 type:complete len:161 (-) Transcript_14752:25-507(-)